MNFGNSHTYQTGTFPPLNPVKPKVRFDGEEFLFESLILEQPINSCHHFEIVREYLSQDELWKETPEKLMSLIGARTLIRFEHLTSKDSYEFSGWVTDVRIDAWEDDETGSGFLPHRSNRVRIIGRGDAMSLDGVPSMHSFIDRQLADIVSEVTREAYFKVECNPRYKGILPYAVQYGESGFEFLNRLSRIYGEPFFYDGRTLFFGVPHAADCEKLFFDSDIVSLRTCASAVPRRYAHYDYVAADDEKGDWSITIKDRGGNAIRLDTRGKNIEISAPEKISLAAKDVDISGEMIRLNAKKHLSSKGQNIILESEEKLSASSKVVNVIAFNKLKTYGGENKILGRQIVQIATPKISTKMSGHSDKDPGNRNQMGNQGLTSQAGFNTIQKGKKTSQSKKNPTQEDLIREQKQMEQIKHNFYTRYALWIQEFIDVLLLWRGDIMSAQENDKIITQPISWTLKLLGASTGIAVTVDAVAFFGQKVYTLICSMGKISCSDFVAEMLDGLTQIKNGIENGGTNAVKPYISNADREGLFQKFLSFAIKQGAEVPEDYTQKLDSFFKRIRAQYPRERFYQYITFVWIRSSQDGWDLADDYAGELEIVCTMSIIGGKANWVVNEFYIDDVSNPNGLLRVLTSKQFFNGGKINALRLPIPIRVRIIPGSRILISTEARYRRNEKGKWEPLDSVNRNQILWNKFLPWANTTKQLELDKLEKD